MWFEKKVNMEQLTELRSEMSQRDCARHTQFQLLEQRISKLEAANNCRDGKHEWESTGEIKNLGDGIFTNVAFTTCKHCGIKKDEWEKHKPTSDLAQAIAGGHGYGRPYVKPQPKRKKGKK